MGYTARSPRLESQADHDRAPLYAGGVSAGSPLPTDDDVEGYLDLNDCLVRSPSQTFFVRAMGESMRDAGIHDGDLLVVDRGLSPQPGNVVVAAVGGELTVKRLEFDPRQDEEGVWLVPANPDFPSLSVEDPQALKVWGVVTYIVHRLE